MTEPFPDTREWLQNRAGLLSQTYICTFFTVLALYLIGSNVQVGGTDLWYHLTGGRLMLDTGTLATPFDRAFATPTQEFVNYYWGFQAIVYAVWLMAGYLGVILLKAALVLLTSYFVLKVLLGERSWQDSTLAQLALFSLVAYLISMRGDELRPHYFTFFFTAFFLYVLMFRERWAPILPLVAILWVNIHGVTWVLGALICAAYTMQKLLLWRDNRDLKPMIAVSLCLPALLINPNGYQVLMAPFLVPPDIDKFVGELQQVKLVPLLDFRNGLIPYHAFLTLLATFLFAMFSIARKQVRQNLMAIILATGAVILLVRGNRFMYDWAILSMPLFIQIAHTWRTIDRNALAKSIVLLMLIGLFAHSWWNRIDHRLPRYPFDENSLPKGTTSFIEQMELEGNYLLPPTFAGYIEWRLSPRVRVHSDMQFPPFTSGHYFEAHAALYSAAALNNIVAKYAPSMIATRITNDQFKSVIATQPDYVPVFFDSTLILYLNKKHFPDVTNRYRLEAINPYKIRKVRAKQLQLAIDELERMRRFNESDPSIDVPLAGFYIQSGNLVAAAQILNDLEARYPDDQSAHFFRAQLAQLQEDYEIAAKYYLLVLKDTDKPGEVGSALANCYFQLGDHRRAFEAFNKAINPSQQADFDRLVDYYLFAFSAYAIGESAHALRLINTIEVLDDGGDPQLRTQVAELKKVILEEG
jgi:thioredoxin-like negative regulator of GroEL